MTINELLATYKNGDSCRLTISGNLEPAGETLIAVEEVKGSLIFTGSIKDWKDKLIPNQEEIGKRTVHSFMTTIAEKDNTQHGFLWVFTDV